METYGFKTCVCGVSAASKVEGRRSKVPDPELSTFDLRPSTRGCAGPRACIVQSTAVRGAASLTMRRSDATRLHLGVGCGGLRGPEGPDRFTARAASDGARGDG